VSILRNPVVPQRTVSSANPNPEEHESAPERSSGVTSRLAALAAPLMIAVIVQSVANLVYHAVVGRTLAPEAYGALGTVLAAMTLLAVPLSALQTAAARTTAKHGLTAATARRAMIRTMLYGLPAVGVMALLAPVIQSYLHLNSLLDALVLAPTLLIAAMVAVARGLLLGVDRSGIVATSYIVSTVGRLGPGLVLAMSMGVTGAVLGTLIGELMALSLLLWYCLKAGPGAPERVPASDLIRTGLVITGLFLFTTIDLFLARHYLSGQDSGLYVAAATIGKTVLALPAAVMSIVYPKLVRSWSSPAALRTLRSSALVVGLPALGGALLIIVLPGLAISLLFGSDAFAGSENVVRLLALIAGSSAFVSLFTHAALARRGANMALPWLGAVLQVIFVSNWHDTPLAIALGSLAALTVTLLVQAAIEITVWARQSMPSVDGNATRNLERASESTQVQDSSATKVPQGR
jgi:O-antigen/teichoic acid export membrane protein